MKARQLLHGLKDKKAGWLTLDIGDGQVSRHFNMREYDESLARDNLALLRGYCVVSALMLAVFMLVRCAVQGVSSVNIVPYFIASAAMGLIRHTLRWKKEGTSDIRWSYALTGLFSIVWYAIAIYYDALITPERPSVFCCLVFLTLALLRMFSRNIPARRRENAWLLGLFRRPADAKTHRRFRCPKCHQKVRVPRGKGKIQITCPQCGEKFIKKT